LGTARRTVAIALVAAAPAAAAQRAVPAPAGQTSAPPGAVGEPAAFDSVLARALDLESANRPREAAVLFRQVLTAGGRGPAGMPNTPAGAAPNDESRVAALLGAERVYAELGQADSVLPLLTPFLRARPGDPVVRTVQLRTLVTLRRGDEARAAYRAWRRVAPGDAAPFREFARLLIAAGERAAADSVLGEAAASPFGRSSVAALRALGPERAQLLAASGDWGAAAGAWRDALAEGGTYEPAAVFSLQGAPDSARAAVAAALLAPPAEAPARRVAAQLLLTWRRPRAARARRARPTPPAGAAT